MNERRSNIELLRCFAMLCIIVYHLLMYVVLPAHPGESIYQALQIPLHIGVPLFVLISGYFGIRFSLRGLMRLFSKSYIYIVPLTLIPSIIGGSSIKDVLKHLFPFGFYALWYLNVYLYLFLLSPIINRYIEGITKKQRVYLLLVLMFISVYIGNVTQGDPHLSDGKNIINFLLLYMIGNTIRQEQSRINSILGRKMFILYILFNIALVLVFMYIPILAGKIWKYSFAYNSPIIIINSVWAFAMFTKLRFSSKFVNWMGGSIFACYLLQSVCWHNCFEVPVQKLNVIFVNPFVAVILMILFGAISMLFMVCIDKCLNPLWNRLIAFAVKYDDKWKINQLR